MRTLVCGDIHGNFEALQQVAQRAKFNKEKDRLIFLGDVVDGHRKSKECIQWLSECKNLIFIIGNHDVWFKKWVETDGLFAPLLWLNQGGYATMESYGWKVKNVPKEHKELFQNAVLFHEQDGMLFVHGGFNPEEPINEQSVEMVTWDRTIITYAHAKPIPKYKAVYIGHTTTELCGEDEPYKLHNLVMVDTGAGWSGKLSMIDIATNECWQSDKTKTKVVQ